jgi:tripartite-type tricarboxylate transporter receptor subunit TctC
VAKVIGDVEKALGRSDVQKSFETTGAQVGTMSGEKFGDFIRRETEKWADVIKTSGVSIAD